MRSRLLVLIPVVLALLACGLGGAPVAQSSSAHPTPFTATPQTGQGIPVLATPIQLLIPDGLATGVTADTIDLVTDQTGAPWDIAPAHLQLTLQGYDVGVSFHVAQIFVYPAQPYAALNPTAAESLKRLQAVLANPAATYDKDTLPRVPFFNAGQVLAAQAKVIHFSGGSGVRFVTQYAQDVSPINNHGLFYHFEGLTNDAKYYIIAILPVNLPFLAADNNPDSPLPSAGIPVPPSSATGFSFEEYFKQVTQKIDAAAATQFSPTLDILDTLIQSIAVSP